MPIREMNFALGRSWVHDGGGDYYTYCKKQVAEPYPFQRK